MRVQTIAFYTACFIFGLIVARIIVFIAGVSP